MQSLYFQSELPLSCSEEKTHFAHIVAGGIQLCFSSGIVELAAAGCYMCASVLM